MARYDVASLDEDIRSITAKLDIGPDLARKSHSLGSLVELRCELEATTLSIRNHIQARVQDEPSCIALEARPPILTRFKAWANGLDLEELASSATPDATVICTALWYLRTLKNKSKWTKTPGGFLLYLAHLPTEQPQSFAWDSADVRTARWWDHRGSFEHGNITSDMSRYIGLLNAEINNHEPEEYHRECLWNEVRNAAVPEYFDAVTIWIPHANQHWDALRPQIFTLFNPSNKYNFIQWMLQWARRVEPEIFGSGHGADATQAAAVIDLTKDLCSGELSPLHVAAVLGLPHLCRDLVSAGADPRRTWQGRLPLNLGFEGDTSGFWSYTRASKAFTKKFSPSEFRFNRFNPEFRAETISYLLDVGPKVCSEPNDGTTDTACLAMWASFKLGDHRLFERSFDRIPKHGQRFFEFLTDKALTPTTALEKECLSRIFTHIQGTLISREEDFETSLRANSKIEEAMTLHEVDLYIVNGECELPQVTPERLAELARYSIIERLPFKLRRISLDPRFDPNPVPGDPVFERETLLHMAVEIDNLEMVDALLRAGADLNVLDEDDRTPLMNAETPRMAEMLIIQYGASTEAQDSEGRTVWHSAAYNNDFHMLRSLAHYDPWKDKNMVRTTDEDCTPLAEAMLLVERLKEVPKRKERAPEPLAARYLLGLAALHGGEECLASPIPLTHLAAAWGEIEMVDDLVACGADWHQLDDEGRTALHWLNFSATPEVVRRLQELCSPNPNSKNSQWDPWSVVESLFLNVPTPPLDWVFKPSQHPSCQQEMSRESFELLLEPLKPEQRYSGDSDGHDGWQRFCQALIATPLLGQLSSVSRSSETALRCVIRAGFLEEYEQSLGQTGILCLRENHPPSARRTKGSNNGWLPQVGAFPAIDILQHSREHLSNAFYRSHDAALLLSHAVSRDDLALVQFLTSAGVKVFDTDDQASLANSPLLTALRTPVVDLVILDCLLQYVGVEELEAGLRHIMNVLVGEIMIARSKDHKKNQVDKLRLLLKYGLDTSGVRNGYAFSYILHTTTSDRHFDFGKLLLDGGAEPDQPCDLCELPNLALCAARCCHLECLKYLITLLGDDFPWGADLASEDGTAPESLNSALMQGIIYPEVIDLIASQTPARERLQEVDFMKTCFRNLDIEGLSLQKLVPCLQMLQKHAPDTFLESLQDGSAFDTAGNVSLHLIRHFFRDSQDRVDENTVSMIRSFIRQPELREHFQEVIDTHYPGSSNLLKEE